jgi:hypothetical protein
MLVFAAGSSAAGSSAAGSSAAGSSAAGCSGGASLGAHPITKAATKNNVTIRVNILYLPNRAISSSLMGDLIKLLLLFLRTYTDQSAQIV